MCPNGFRPLRPVDGYLPIEDHALVGDGSTCALVARDGAVAWLCVPRFDSPPVFCGILDRRRGGHFRIAPEQMVETRQRYEPDSAVVVTEMRTSAGTVEVRDCMVLRSGADLREDAAAARGELLRSVRAVSGDVRLHVEIEPRGGCESRRRAEGLRLASPALPGLDLQLEATRPLEGRRTVMDLRQGDRVDFVLRWGGAVHRHAGGPDPGDLLRQTTEAWRRWIGCLDYDGPQREAVRRSAITLKLLDHFASGAIVAAATSSLPEAIGGVRNWDYRFSWVRDAAFSVYAFRRVGLGAEAAGFLGWVLDAVDKHGRAGVLYDIDGVVPPGEREDPDLEGYRASAPVRWGNAADGQVQNDALGEIIDCAYQWVSAGGDIEAGLWSRLRPFIDRAATVWDEPDHGIWEVRTPGRVFTYSAAMCQVALDRGAKLARRFRLSGDPDAWESRAQHIRRTILDDAWDDEQDALTEHLGGGGGLDASLLSLPLRRVVPADHPRMVATTKAIGDRLGAGQGLLYRYRPKESPDGLPGEEGAFLLCSFWMVDNLAYQGRLDEAGQLYESLCARGGELGLLAEQVDPSTGEFLGNYPQAFSHVGVLASGMNLARLTRAGS